MVFANCYDLDDFLYKQHFFVRVFRTELGGGQLFRTDQNVDGPLSLSDLTTARASCTIDGKEVRLELVNYRAPTLRGWCGLCEQTGFRLTIDGETIWEIERPEPRGEPIFNGTIDVDRDIARICVENTPDALGVALPYEPDFFQSRTSILVCKTISH
jgi:hypothetical protein